MVQSVCNTVKGKVGKLIAVLFGITLLLEVAALPLVTSFATRFDKYVVAEVTESDDQEVKQREVEGPFLAILEVLPAFSRSENDWKSSLGTRILERETQFKEPFFILNHSLLI